MYGPYPSDRVRRGLTKPERYDVDSFSECQRCGCWHDETDDCRFEDVARLQDQRGPIGAA